MIDIIKVSYAQTGDSIKTNTIGMREMQERAYSERGFQYFPLKVPPESGKSRALMFVALDKLTNQGLQKVIVAVPEKSIGGSFGRTDLMSKDEAKFTRFTFNYYDQLNGYKYLKTLGPSQYVIKS